MINEKIPHANWKFIERKSETFIPMALFQFKANLAAILKCYCCHGNITYKFILALIRLLTCFSNQINLLQLLQRIIMVQIFYLNYYVFY